LPERRPEFKPISAYLGKEVRALAEGTVKWFSEKKGYGFITMEEGQDLFVHHSSIEMAGFRTLSEGDKVSFDVEDTDRGPQAKNVKRI
jgi:CspA family cold shock protein